MNWCFIAVMVLLISCGQSHKGSEKTTTELSDHPVPPGKENIPAESIFQLKDSFQTQENTPFTLSFLKGTPTVVGMIFTHCTYACPRLTADIKNIADSLKGQKVNFVLVSFDTKRDNPTRLKLFAHEMGLNTNWILLHGSEETVRTLSVLLHVQYEEDAEGNFSHSNLISVLDKYGVLQYQKEGLEADHSETITTIKKLIQQQ
ncbi:MAG: SCO family protein [Saprospiraceae bacterium]|nr:SCO family protein [Candidatus Brachybacter algidus]MBK6378242.1 SCO family protein [Chitinophagaceae bacterium]MBK8749271.1 SCO family protein [Candidatus Brachybacter algidus]HQW43713.1 SCO family protein [Chitinophagaceae bacterium]